MGFKSCPMFGLDENPLAPVTGVDIPTASLPVFTLVSFSVLICVSPDKNISGSI